MVKKQIIETVKKYIKAIEAHNIRVEKAYLFGSYAHDTAKSYSDIDVAIVSPDFGKSYLEETCTLMRIARDVDIMISPDPYSVEEYENAGKGDFLYQEIINKGKLIQA
ncbi:MAG: DNA polymerase III subunit beta [Candidatus Melainabacteria bacterium GWF2_37_15]|nr:MAG: DNA polymerase III subunit beta [Candidatus Melainabacteria bacterium GWF2_37_15]